MLGRDGGGLRKCPWECDPDVSLWRSPSVPDDIFGVQPPRSGGSRWGRKRPGRRGGRVPTTPPLPRGAIFKSIFSCLIRPLLSQQTRAWQRTYLIFHPVLDSATGKKKEARERQPGIPLTSSPRSKQTPNSPKGTPNAPFLGAGLLCVHECACVCGSWDAGGRKTSMF